MSLSLINSQVPSVSSMCVSASMILTVSSPYKNLKIYIEFLIRFMAKKKSSLPAQRSQNDGALAATASRATPIDPERGREFKRSSL
jgi:hypothetical protein